MKLTVDNQFKGLITSTTSGATMALATINCAGLGASLTSMITQERLQELQLIAGKEAYALISPFDVMLARSDMSGAIGANMLIGTVDSIQQGAVNSVITIALSDSLLKAIIPVQYAAMLGLKNKDKIIALINPNKIQIGIE